MDPRANATTAAAADGGTRPLFIFSSLRRAVGNERESGDHLMIPPEDCRNYPRDAYLIFSSLTPEDGNNDGHGRSHGIARIAP